MKYTLPFLMLCIFCHLVAAQKEESISPSFKKKQAELQKCYYQVDKYTEGIELANDLFKSAQNDLEKGVALQEKVIIILHSSTDYQAGEPALPFAFQAAKFLSNTPNREYFHKALNLIANCYIKRYYLGPGDPIWEKSEYYTCLALRVQTDSTFYPKINYEDTFEDKYASKEIIKNSIKYTTENLNFWAKKGSKPHMMWRNQTLGKLYWNLNNNYEQAESYLLKAHQLSKEIGDVGFAFTILNQLTTFALQDKLYEKSIYYAEINLANAIKQKNEIREGSIRDQLYLAYDALGKKSTAITHKERSFAINEKYYRQTEYERTKLYKERNEVLEKQSVLQKELTAQNNIKWMLSTTVGILLLLLGALFYYSRQLKLKNESIRSAMLAGQTIERKRVAMDLHDNLGSTLSALWMSMDVIDPSKMSPHEKEIHLNLKENLEKAYNDVRLLSHNLLPEEFEKQGLVTTLQDFARKMNKNSSVRFDLNIEEPFGRVDHKVEFELYSICLELVNNIIKHSKASVANISLSRIGKQVTLTIADNGIGTIINENNGKGMKNVKARVESMNGSWEVENPKNKGMIHKIQIQV